MAFWGNETADNREYAAISATSIAAYPSEETENLLKKKLSSRNWYVRYNSAESLSKLGLDYTQLIDVFKGNDRYAGETAWQNAKHGYIYAVKKKLPFFIIDNIILKNKARNAKIERNLSSAVKNREFKLYLQFVINPENGEIC